LVVSTQKANRTGVARGGAAGYEVPPGAGMPGLLNRRPLDREPSLERSGFNGLPERELSYVDFLGDQDGRLN